MKSHVIFTLIAAVTVFTVLPALGDVADVGLMFDPNGGWESIGLSGGGGIFNPSVSPLDSDLRMIRCDMSGAYICHNAGYNWTMIRHSELRGMSVPAAFHPTNINTIYGGSGSSVLLSNDRGRTWEQIANVGATLQTQIAIDPEDPNFMLVGAGDGVWRSNDAGYNWTQVSGPNGEVLGIHIDTTSSVLNRVCFAGTENGVWRSDDRGVNWVDKSGGLPWTDVQGFGGGSNSDTMTVILYCAILSKNVGGFQGGVYKSTDKGDTWVSAMGNGINKDTRSYDSYAMGEIAQYYHTLTTNVDPQIVYTYNASTGFWPPHHPTVYRSTDAGANWTAVFYQDPRFTGQYNVEYNYHTAYLNQAWQSVPNSAMIAPSDPNILMHTDNEMCYITNNGGVSWFNGQTRPVPGSPTPPTDFLNTGLVVTSSWHYYIDPFQSNRHYICYTDIGFASSLDSGQTWKWGFKAIPWSNTTYELAFDPDTPGKIWGAFSEAHDIPNANVILGGHSTNRSGGVGVSYDYGATWTKRTTGIMDGPVCSVIVDPTSPAGNRTLYAATFNYGLYKSTNDGASWVSKNIGLGTFANKRTYRVRRHNDGTLFCVVTAKYDGSYDTTGVGLYKSTDGADSWTRINDFLLWPKDFVVDPEDSDIIYIGAANAGNTQGGLWRTLNGGTSWTKIGDMGNNHFGGYLHPSRPGYVYATMGDWGAPEDASLWLSKDYGTTWEPFLKLPFSRIQRVYFDPADNDTIYVTTFGGSVFKGRYKPHVEDYYDYLDTLTSKWLEQGCDGSNNCDGADLSFNSKVDFPDYAVLAAHWLENQEEVDYLQLEGFEFYTGSTVGDNPLRDTWEPTGATETYYYLSTGVAHTGDKSLYISYYNADPPYFCGVSRTSAPEDWTIGGTAESLSLWYKGSATIDEMYVRLTDSDNDIAIVRYSDAWDTDDLQLEVWQHWNITLQRFVDDNPSFDMGAVKTIELGVGEPVTPDPVPGLGAVYFDDIQLIVP